MNADLSRVKPNSLSNPFRAFKPKEWWSSGFHDPETNSWLDFSFHRSARQDRFQILLFQPGTGKTQIQHWKGRFGRPEVDDQIRLEAVQTGFCARLQRHDDGLARFEFSTSGWEIDLEIRSTLAPWRSGDRQFEASYDLHQRFQLLATGRITSPEGNLELVHAPGHSEHSWATMPRQCRWHRLVAQNDKFCLDSLVGVGAFANSFTTVMDIETDPWRCIRLNPDVRLRNSKGFEWEGPWRLESSELEMNIELIQVATCQNVFPPLVPLVENTLQTKAFVRATGRARIDGIWHNTGEMHGVFEEQSGYW